MAKRTVVFLDPSDARKGAISEAFLLVNQRAQVAPDSVESWSAWGPSFLTSPQVPLPQRASAAMLQWWNHAKLRGITGPRELLTAAAIIANQYGIGDEFISALGQTTSPELAREARALGLRSYTDQLKDATGVTDGQDRLDKLLAALGEGKQGLSLGLGIGLGLAAALAVYVATSK